MMKKLICKIIGHKYSKPIRCNGDDWGFWVKICSKCGHYDCSLD